MRFIAITLIVRAPDPFTGVQKSTRMRFREVLGSALLAEELGFDGFGAGPAWSCSSLTSPRLPPPADQNFGGHARD